MAGCVVAAWLAVGGWRGVARQEEGEEAAPGSEGQTEPSEVVYYPHVRRQWNRVPVVTVATAESDARLEMLLAAVEFWNGELAGIGSGFRLGAVSRTDETVPGGYPVARTRAVVGGPGSNGPVVPEVVAGMAGDIVVAMSEASFVSFAAGLPGDRVLVGIRGLDSGPFPLPNVARNVIAHELGHALGLGHHNDPTKLMCGRPADCRPDAFQSEVARFFPLPEVEQQKLLSLYPADREPTHRTS